MREDLLSKSFSDDTLIVRTLGEYRFARALWFQIRQILEVCEEEEGLDFDSALLDYDFNLLEIENITKWATFSFKVGIVAQPTIRENVYYLPHCLGGLYFRIERDGEKRDASGELIEDHRLPPGCYILFD